MRGPQSSVYGSDGLSGVINIQTRNPAEEGGFASIQLGESGFTQASLTGKIDLKPHTLLSFSAGFEDDGNELPGNAYKSKSASLALNTQVRPDATASLRGLVVDSDSESFPDDSGGPQLAVIRTLESRAQSQASLSANVMAAISERLDVNLVLGTNTHEERGESPAIAPGVREGVPSSTLDSKFDRTNIALNAVFAYSESITGTMGLDYLRESGALQGQIELFPGLSLPQDFELDRNTVNWFGELSATPNAATTVTLSLRSDHADQFGKELTGRLGIQYQLRNSQVFATVANGFKLPSQIPVILQGNNCCMPWRPCKSLI